MGASHIYFYKMIKDEEPYSEEEYGYKETEKTRRDSISPVAVGEPAA
jgi:hypothetical protein